MLDNFKAKAKQKAVDSNIANQVSNLGQTKYVEDVMSMEECDRETALRLCLGLSDPVDYEHTLGYKMADTVWFLGMFKQAGRKARLKARENFKKQLCPEELELFEKYCEGMNAGKIRAQTNREMKAEKKKRKGKLPPDADLGALDLDDD